MVLAIAGGSAGTGRTTLAVSLAQVAAADHGAPVRLLDCDVEAPNAALLLPSDFTDRRDALLPVPEVDAERCDHCGRCGELCSTKAIADTGSEVFVTPDICIGCGVCTRECPRKAIRETPHVLGTLAVGRADGIAFSQGCLHVGRSQSAAVIRALKAWQLRPGEGGLRILDAPAGSTGPAMEAVRGSDLALLVVDPTPAGRRGLERAVPALRDALGLPAAVVLNRSRGADGDAPIETCCGEMGVPILLRIPYRRQFAEAHAAGVTLVDAFPEWREPLESLLKIVRRERIA